MSKKLSGVKTCIIGPGQLNGDLRMFAANFIPFSTGAGTAVGKFILERETHRHAFPSAGARCVGLGFEHPLKEGRNHESSVERCLARLHVCLLPDLSQCVSSLSVVCLCSRFVFEHQLSQLVSEEGADIR